MEKENNELAKFNDLASFIQVTKKEIMDRPNDQELGKYIRELVYSEKIIDYKSWM